MRAIEEETAEVKRMWVGPAYRRRGIGRGALEHLTDAARDRGYRRVRLDSPDFMTAAHAL
jgi:GNAT superfamily N-acetyltransferase